MFANRQVYDVTDFISKHPGGKVILTYAGRDATDVFSTFHATLTWSLLRPMCIGDLEVKTLSHPPIQLALHLCKQLDPYAPACMPTFRYIFMFCSN